jgi:hypothetical protein
MFSEMTCPKCKVETSPLQVFGWADFYLCPKCELAFDLTALKLYQQLPPLPAPVTDSFSRSPPRR